MAHTPCCELLRLVCIFSLVALRLIVEAER